MFQTQYLHNKRIKKQNEKEREQKKLKKLQEERERECAEQEISRQEQIGSRANKSGSKNPSPETKKDVQMKRSSKDIPHQKNPQQSFDQKHSLDQMGCEQITSRRNGRVSAFEKEEAPHKSSMSITRNKDSSLQKQITDKIKPGKHKGDVYEKDSDKILEPKEPSPTLQNRRSSTMDTRNKKEQKDGRAHVKGAAQQQLSLEKEQSSRDHRQVTINYPQNSINSSSNPNSKNENREKIKKMKDIRKYFDSIFREIKEINREIMNQNEDFSDGLPPAKSKQRKDKEAEALKKAIEKAYHTIRLNSKHIDQKISLVFREYNELSLIHESKLGHALKDMQQFLEYQQSSDETIQSIQGKLDMIINIQEKRMFIEIFGEDPMDCNLMKKHVRGSAAEASNRPSLGLSSDAFAGGYAGRPSNELKFCQPDLRQHMSENTSKLNSKAKENMNGGSDSNNNESILNDENTSQEAESNSEFQMHDQKRSKLDANERSDKKSSKKKLKKHSSDYRRESFKSRHRPPNAGIFSSILGSRSAKPFSSTNLKQYSEIKRLKGANPGLQRSRIAALMGVPPGPFPGPLLPGAHAPPLMLSNLIQNQIKMDIQNIQKQQLIKQLQSMQSFQLNPNFQNLHHPLQQIQNMQQLSQNQFPQPPQAPSQQLNLTILNNGQNFMNLPGSAAGANLHNIQSMQQMTHNQMLLGQLDQQSKLQLGQIATGAQARTDDVENIEQKQQTIQVPSQIAGMPQQNTEHNETGHNDTQQQQYTQIQEQIRPEANAVDFLNKIDRMRLEKLIQQQQQSHQANDDQQQAQENDDQANEYQADQKMNQNEEYKQSPHDINKS